MRLKGGVAASAQGTVKTGLDRGLDVLCCLYDGIKLGKFSPFASNSDSFAHSGGVGLKECPHLLLCRWLLPVTSIPDSPLGFFFFIKRSFVEDPLLNPKAPEMNQGQHQGHGLGTRTVYV